MLKVAAIDVGSNAIRMMVGKLDDSWKLKLLENIRIPVRLGQDVFTKGTLKEASMQQTVEAFCNFQRMGKNLGIYRLRAVATSAMREAANGHLLADRIYRASEIKVDIIDGDEEARLIHLAVTHTLIELYYQKKGVQMSKKDKPIHVKLIANPGAAGPGNASLAAKNLKLATGYLEKNGLKVDVALAKPKEKATPIARKAVRDGYQIVIAMGGDGTIEAVMRGMIGSKVRLGLIMGGTENNIAKSLGIPQDLEEACALIASNNMLKLDLGQVTTNKKKKFFFFEMATIGLAAAVYPSANKVAHGKLSNIKAVLSAFVNHETKPTVFLTLDDESKIEVETIMVMVSNTPMLGKNFLVAPKASLQDGFLDISVYPEFGKVELLRYYASVMDGGYSGDKKVQHYQARKVKIKASPILNVMADGVSLGRGTVTIKALQGALRIITTEKNLGVGIPQKKTAQVLPAPVSLTVGKNHRVENVISPE